MTKWENTALVFGVVVALVLAGWYYAIHQPSMPSAEPQLAEQRVVSVGDTSIYVDVADTEASRERGLSGRDSLAPNSGMLFVFDTDGTWGIWMKDMKFSIDVVWLSQDGTVITVTSNASPDSYPQVFKPAKPARYVVELPAGFAKAHDIGKGSKFVL